jgi:hypothetical protein
LPTLPLRLAVVAPLAALAACGWRGPGLAGYPGLQWDVVSFYGGRAMEANARCPNPRITTITHADVVEEDAEHVVMDLRYGWVDDTQTVDSGAGGGSKIVCRGWGERRFTFDRRSDGGLEVVGMTGSQQR